MDYDKFKDEYEKYTNWQTPKEFFKLDSKYLQGDAVNSPAHYTRGSQEAIDIIEEAIQDAPSVTEGMLHAQVLKYLLRLWLKDNPAQDAKKARWYLDRLIAKIQSAR